MHHPSHSEPETSVLTHTVIRWFLTMDKFLEQSNVAISEMGTWLKGLG